MTILCIILAAFCCIHNNVILLTAPGSFYKVSRHPARFLAVFSRFNRSTVIYTAFIFKAVKKACRQLKTWIIQRNAPRQGNQKRHPGTKPARIAAGPDQLQPVQDQPQLEPTNHRNRVH